MQALYYTYFLNIFIFLACIEESVGEREGKQFEKGLNSKLDRYKRFLEGSRI